jgi:hypothetical protein
MKNILLLSLFLAILTLQARAQFKFEKEYRLKPSAVPEKALTLVESLGFLKKIQWYAEEGIGKKSIEAKTLHNNKKYSIEFDTSGNFLDLEKDISPEQIPPLAIERMHSYLDSVFSSHKTMKIQAHFNGNPEDIPLLLEKGLSDFSFPVKYEWVVKGKTAGRPKMYEFMFTNDGRFETKKEILLRNTDNLEF